MTTSTGVSLAATLITANVPGLRQLLPLVFLEFSRVGGVEGFPLETSLTVTAYKGLRS